MTTYTVRIVVDTNDADYVTSVTRSVSQDNLLRLKAILNKVSGSHELALEEYEFSSSSPLSDDEKDFLMEYIPWSDHGYAHTLITAVYHPDLVEVNLLED